MKSLHYYFITVLLLFLSEVLVKAENYNIIDFGAKADTSVLSTLAIQKAIDKCFSDGGGIVTVPSGAYKTGTIILKSNVHLYFESGSILYGSKNLKDYLDIKPDYISLRTQEATKQLIYAEKAENVGISGFGEVNGQGRNFAKLTKNDEGITRPHLIRFINCRNVVIENVSLRNSACWMQHYLVCENVQIRGIRIYNHNNFNNDGLDLDGCKNVTVSDIISDSDDDGITLKSTSPKPCENIVITNCVVSSHCNAIKMGTESNGGFKNITISNCVVKPSVIQDTFFYGSVNGTSGVSLEIVDGGVMQNVSVSHIVIDGTRSPLFIRLANRARPYKKGLEIKNVGKIDDISLCNIKIQNAKPLGCSITGIPEHPVENVTLTNITMDMEGGGILEDITRIIPEKIKEYPEATMFGILPAYGFYIRHASNITMNGIIISTQKEDLRPAFVLDDVGGAEFTNIHITSTAGNEANYWFHQTNNSVIRNNMVKGSSNCFVKITGEKSGNISILNNRLENVKQIYTNDETSQLNILESGNK